MNQYIQLAAFALQRLESEGFEAFLVGGCVREALRAELGQSTSLPEVPDAGQNPGQESALDSSLPATDIDITTNALPEEICRVFSDLAVIETGIKHGTVTVLVPACPASADPPEGNPACAADAAAADSFAVAPGGVSDPTEKLPRRPIEITTYRVDGAYSDGRHPDQVRFVTSLKEDLRRRDFTVNALAMNLRGELADPFGGRADLEAGTIRAVGDAEARFREDGLRILRALRFAAVLDYEIEPQTEAALKRCAPLLEEISAERIFAELKKLVCGGAAGRVVRRYADVLAVIIPQMAPMKGFRQNNPYHKYDVLEHCVRAMEAVRPERAPGEDAAPGYCMKLAALLHDIGKPGTYSVDENGIGHFYGHPQEGAVIVRQVMKRLKADRFTSERMETLVRYHDLVFQEDDRLLKRWMNRYSPQVLLEILEIKRADNIATGNVSQELLDKFDRIEQRIRSIRREAAGGRDCFAIRDLAVNGRDLMEAGFPEGPEIGRILQTLLEEVIDGQLPNERQALLDRAADCSFPPAE
ncbi:MAG: HD domain-containing protein [Firmicutes bacterium]|nr:HD domain-containing protein [Bacillota bacterium]